MIWNYDMIYSTVLYHTINIISFIPYWDDTELARHFFQRLKPPSLLSAVDLNRNSLDIHLVREMGRRPSSLPFLNAAFITYGVCGVWCAESFMSWSYLSIIDWCVETHVSRFTSSAVGVTCFELSKDTSSTVQCLPPFQEPSFGQDVSLRHCHCCGVLYLGV